MLDELRIYSLDPAAVADYLRISADIAVPVRGDRYGKLLGFWHGDVGAALRIFNLWQHQDFAARAVARSGLDGLEAWKRDYLPLIRPMMRAQDIRFLAPLQPLRAPDAPGGVHEFRFLKTRVGTARSVADALRAAVATVPGCTLLGLWTALAGDINEVTALLAWRDWPARSAAGLLDPAWQGFLRGMDGAVTAMESSLVVPAAHSPLR